MSAKVGQFIQFLKDSVRLVPGTQAYKDHLEQAKKEHALIRAKKHEEWLKKQPVKDTRYLDERT